MPKKLNVDGTIKTYQQLKEEYKKILINYINKSFIIDFKYIIFDELPFSYGTFKKYKLNKDEDVINAIEKCKKKIFNKLIIKWMKSNNPTLQIALMKIISDDNIRDILSNKNVDENVTKSFLNIKDLTKTEIKSDNIINNNDLDDDKTNKKLNVE